MQMLGSGLVHTSTSLSTGTPTYSKGKGVLVIIKEATWASGCGQNSKIVAIHGASRALRHWWAGDDACLVAPCRSSLLLAPSCCIMPASL